MTLTWEFSVASNNAERPFAVTINGLNPIRSRLLITSISPVLAASIMELTFSSSFRSPISSLVFMRSNGVFLLKSGIESGQPSSQSRIVLLLSLFLAALCNGVSDRHLMLSLKSAISGRSRPKPIIEYSLPNGGAMHKLSLRFGISSPKNFRTL